MAFKKPSAYVPSFLRTALEGSRHVQLTFNDVIDSNILSSSSFIYDQADAPLKSTQQLNVDWSQFENHTFFMSAEAKVNLAFEQIINGYPFDGTRAEVESFFEKMTGFDKYVFDQFPKYRGQLHFSGSQVGETSPTAGSYIIVTDAAGGLYPDLSKNKTGESILNPGSNSLSVETQVYIPSIATDGTQVICQKLSSDTSGFSLYLVPTVSTTDVEARFSIVSGSSTMTVSTMLDKGQFNHICVTLNRDLDTHYLEFFKDATSISTTKTKCYIGELDIDASEFIIGSGTVMTLGSTVVTPDQTFSGTLDEFRVFHSTRSTTVQAQFASKSLFAQPELKLYYRFNEPVPVTTNIDDEINAIVIDSSGNSLHGIISNFVDYITYDGDGNIETSLRQDAASDPLNPVIYEKLETAPVLFPAHADVIDLNTLLLGSASTYDQANPNLITRLIPPHYLLEGALFDGFEEPEGEGNNPYGGDGGPGQGKLGGVQLFLSLLYIWARFFDEMKLFIDSFSTLKTVSYNTNVSMPNNFLLDFVKQFGFYLPPMFNDSTLEQYVAAENIAQGISTNEYSLKYVQNELLRRILINLPDVIKSKGTQHSIKAFLRAIGIDPENSVRLREYGGPTTRQLSFSRETKRDVGAMVEFFSTSSLAISPYLTASRLEPGYPEPAGTFVLQDIFTPNGISNDPNDGLLTSGSWTVESLIKYKPTHLAAMTNVTQSLARLCVTGTFSGAKPGLVANLLVASSSIDPKLILYVRSGNETSSPLLRLTLDIPETSLFDGGYWNVSFGCVRNDVIGSLVSSSYFLRLGNQANGEIENLLTTSSFFSEPPTTNMFRMLNTASNTSGSFLAVGTNQTIPAGAGNQYLYLNDSSLVPDEARITDFNGMISNFRFWSKALTETEWKEHIRNYRSLGVEDPLVNYNFVHTRSGSFEKIRLDTFTKQETRRACASASLGTTGSIMFLDFSLNNMHLSGTNFPIDRDCVKTEIFDFSYISPYFDEATTNEKIRIRSFQNQELIDQTPWASVAPVHELVKSEQPTDDTRFVIEFSLLDALNRDIVTMFATLDAFDSALGNPELVFSPDYPDLETLRNIYFNRISDKLNFKSFFEFFRWFDTSIGTFIEQLIPKKTKFKGTNFVIESHMLERHKLGYLFNEIYIGQADRQRIKDVLMLQLITGNVHKF